MEQRTVGETMMSHVDWVGASAREMPVFEGYRRCLEGLVGIDLAEHWLGIAVDQPLDVLPWAREGVLSLEVG